MGEGYCGGAIVIVDGPFRGESHRDTMVSSTSVVQFCQSDDCTNFAPPHIS